MQEQQVHSLSPSVQSGHAALVHQHPQHWGYAAHVHHAGVGQPPTGVLSSSAPSPMMRLGSKRALSESDDNDDLYSESSSKDKCMSPSNSGNCEMLSRKKRRGVIEKKRRDRINSSLSELKRLIPSAFDKQNSSKLEKAEILQLTVDHLKALHAKGFDSYESHCSAKFAMDYHGMGYRECAAEVSRYLERIEGLDGQNPLRLRLSAHLQTCAAQREKSAASAGTASAAPVPTAAAVAAPVPAPSSSGWPPYVGAVTSASAPVPVSTANHSHDNTHHAYTQAQYTDLQPYHHHAPPPVYAQHNYMTSMDASAAFHHNHHGHHHHHSPHGPQGATVTTAGSAAAAAAAAALSKPYRPWGAELAY